jgi:hypothetical protein
MFRVAALAIVLASPVPLAAQRIPVPKPNPNFRWSDQGLGRVSSVRSPDGPEPAPKDRVTCLEKKASGKTVCHTRAEWQRIAQRL